MKEDPTTGYPILSLSVYNTTSSHYNTAIFFGKTANPPSYEEGWDIAMCDSLGDGLRFSTIIPLNETKAVYVIEGDAQNENKLFGGYVNSTVSDWGALTQITEHNVMTRNSKRIDYSVSYDSLYGHVTYVSVDWDLYYFTINLETFTKSSETLIWNGTSTHYPLFPLITVNDYTPSIFFWNTTGAGGGYGLAIELNANNQWTFDTPVRVTSMSGTTLSGICPITYQDTAIMGFGAVETTYFKGSTYNFTGYGFGEEIEYIPNWLDLYFGFGIFMSGVILMLIAPSWLAFSVRRGLKDADETIKRAIFALLLFAIGYCLMIAHLGEFV